MMNFKLLLFFLASSASLAGAVFQQLSYGQHPRQVVGVWDDGQSNPASPWIVYIHGGAWRNMQQSYRDFEPSVNNMMTSGLFPRGTVYASIDYRLSPCAIPNANPCPYPVQHPDHILDVRTALQMLARRRGLKSNYILIGHSAGATLSFQLLMGEAALQGHPLIRAPLPTTVIGIAGIYDMRGLNNRFGGQYGDFLTEAFGPDQRDWDRASPALFAGSFRERLPSPGGVILARSAEDSLVDGPELDEMARRLSRDGIALAVERRLRGEHNAVWQDGHQIPSLVTRVMPRRRQK